MKAYLSHLTIRRVVVLKCVVAVGLLASYLLPAEAAVVVSLTTNMVWLFKI